MNIDRLAGFLSQNTVLLTVFRGLQYARVSAPLRQEPTSQSSSAAMSIALDMYYENKMWNRLVMVIGRLEWINVLEHCAKEKNERSKRASLRLVSGLCERNAEVDWPAISCSRISNSIQ